MTRGTTVDLLQGSLDMLILKVLDLEEMHGWGISQRIQQTSDDVLQVTQGSLYPALHRLERKRLIASRWGTSDNNRKAKYYTLTNAGAKQVATEEANWTQYVDVVGRIISAAGV